MYALSGLYGHGERITDAPLSRGILVSVEGGGKGRGRSKVTWMEVMRKDLEKLGITLEVTLNWNT